MRIFRLLAVLVVVGLVAASTASAQTNLGLMGLGGKVGYVMPEGDIGNTIGLGVQAKLGTIIPTVALDAFVDFWTKGYEAHYMGSGADWSFSEISIGALAKYYFPTTGTFRPYAAAGLALAIGRSSWELKNVPIYPIPGFQTSGSSSDSEIAIHLVAGGQMPLSPKLDGFAELKYATDGADYFAIMAGAIFKLGE